jgi:putative transposase
MTIPYRGKTFAGSTYFVTGNTFFKKSLFHVDRNALLFIDVLFHYRDEKKYLVHEFVVMPNHFHLLVTPQNVTLENALQLIRGSFSYRRTHELRFRGEFWQPSFVDRRVRDATEYQRYKEYIHQNPVKKSLARTPEEYPYSSASGTFRLDPVPQRLKPLSSSTSMQA